MAPSSINENVLTQRVLVSSDVFEFNNLIFVNVLIYLFYILHQEKGYFYHPVAFLQTGLNRGKRLISNSPDDHYGRDSYHNNNNNKDDHKHRITVKMMMTGMG